MTAIHNQSANPAALIRARARDLGFHKVGITRVETLASEQERFSEWLRRGYHGEMSWMARDPEQRTDPRKLFPAARSVIVVALNYQTPHQHSDKPGKVSRYAWGDDYHDVLRDKLKALLAWIKDRVPDVEGKICVDSSPMMDKVWAARAGLGWIGKHTNLITREYSSWVFLGELLLSIELDYESQIESDHCGTCTACIEACPTQAIIEPYLLDATRCISYGTIELRSEELPEPIRSNLEGWVFGCDICQDVCPWNRFAKPSAERRFQPTSELQNLVRSDWEEFTEEVFDRVFKDSAVQRTKFAGLKRNIEFVKG